MGDLWKEWHSSQLHGCITFGPPPQTGCIEAVHAGKGLGLERHVEREGAQVSIGCDPLRRDTGLTGLNGNLPNSSTLERNRSICCGPSSGSNEQVQ